MGWSCHEIFSENGGFIPGLYRLPIYPNNKNPNDIFVNGIDKLGNLTLFIRIGLNGDPIDKDFPPGNFEYQV